MEERWDQFSLCPKNISIGRRYRERIGFKKVSELSEFVLDNFEQHQRHLIIAWRNFCREMLSVEMILKPGMFSKTPFPKAFIRPQSVQEDISGIRFIQSLLVGPLQHLVRGSPDCGMETSER